MKYTNIRFFYRFLGIFITVTLYIVVKLIVNSQNPAFERVTHRSMPKIAATNLA